MIEREDVTCEEDETGLSRIRDYEFSLNLELLSTFTYFPGILTYIKLFNEASLPIGIS